MSWIDIDQSNTLQDPQAQYILGRFYFEGNKIAKSNVQAIRWLNYAADQGHESARLLKQKIVNGNAHDFVKENNFNESQGLEDDHAQYILSCLYLDGKEVEQNDIEGMKWLRHAAQWNDEANSLLDLILDHADAGDRRSQERLGHLFFFCDGESSDINEAVKWYTSAADQGSAEAQYWLGCIYDDGLIDTGQSLKDDQCEALKYYHLAADQGHCKAKERLISLQKGDQ